MCFTTYGGQRVRRIKKKERHKRYFFPKTHLLKPQNDFFFMLGGQRVRRIKKKSAPALFFPKTNILKPQNVFFQNSDFFFNKLRFWSKKSPFLTKK